MVKFCCADMRSHIFLIDQNIVLDGNVSDKVVHYSSRFNEYGIPMNDGYSYILISYCPWCGSKLPDSLRERWFEELEELGFENLLFNNDIPTEYKTSQWWNIG